MDNDLVKQCWLFEQSISTLPDDIIQSICVTSSSAREDQAFGQLLQQNAKSVSSKLDHIVLT